MLFIENQISNYGIVINIKMLKIEFNDNILIISVKRCNKLLFYSNSP